MFDLIVIAVITVLIHQTVWYLLSLMKNDSSLADVAWGMCFITTAVVLLLKAKDPSASTVLVTLLVTFWGSRLSFHILKRRIGKPEDERYANWRKQWGKSFLLRSYFQNYLFQGLLALIISAPIIVAANSGIVSGGLHWWQLPGLAIWAVGFIIEATADWQLNKFLKTKKPSQIMQSGLWSYSRHPNYFGEITQWWGLWLIVAGLPSGLWAIISSILITYLIIFVSGVPLLERKYKNNKEYQKYAKHTSPLILLPPK